MAQRGVPGPSPRPLPASCCAGSTDGIGLHTAQRLASQGATVLVHGRSEGRVQQAVQAVQQAGAGSGGSAQGFTEDLASLVGVRRLADRVQRDHPSLHVLINNAGDGLEMTYAVNVAAPFLLTACLLGAVRERVVNVASISAASSIDFANLQQWGEAHHSPRIKQERGYSAHGAYSLSKLADMLFTFGLAARLQAAGSPLTCNCLDPGTDADDELRAATDPSLARVSGAYFVGGRPARSPAVAYDQEVQARLWGVLEEQTGAVWSV
ncbi:hypothetical protein CHLNCDRAFT_48791 [Chlorella variabilis]|uniref:Short-chain dehydrogenase n=1 Tax=Chlorella variabilis TaxID=554065 RepID=E1ZDN1_CHLVA|nr:hypothetical protein CHLNCDRAFT_48791 [Chlorella variabilis]EFN55890.1 hypothetical protein CHLNCDRAFT_48791 [Chlorella variabilis]|eukprot:XP_005847992.1 hypothetical protein CHLNCDRAFT_48791 [Chlorella variabilis]